MKKKNPIAILEDSLNFIKDYIEEEFNDSSHFFDEKFVSKVKQSTQECNFFCEELNKNNDFIIKLNSLLESNFNNGIQYEAQHFLFSDCIALFKKNNSLATAKSKFVLAYFYDVLINNHFADEKAIDTLNKIVSTSDFNVLIEKICSQNTLNSSLASHSFLLSAASKNEEIKDKILSAYNNFTLLAFNLNVEKEKIDTKAEQGNNNILDFDQNDSLDKVLAELNQLVGLEKVKQDVKELINLLEIQKKRNQQGLKNIEVALHTVFLGPPGTGKTSVARLLSRIFKHLGFLSKGQLYETDREGMIAGFVGQTATKVDKVVDESIGGVLFIDEAYGLTQNTFGNDYGSEAVNTLLKRMEDYRDDLAVVVAGYKEPMQVFIESNPGLRSRFNRYFFFEHFEPNQLVQIFQSFCKNADFVLNKEALEKISDTFELLYDKKDDSFGNARSVRNLFEKCVQNQANRIVNLKKLSSKTLKTITEQDIPEPSETVKQVFL